jgi:hypothetical protein
MHSSIQTQSSRPKKGPKKRSKKGVLDMYRALAFSVRAYPPTVVAKHSLLKEAPVTPWIIC